LADILKVVEETGSRGEVPAVFAAFPAFAKLPAGEEHAWMI